MNLLVTQTFEGSLNGFQVQTFEKGETIEASEAAAQVFLANGFCVVADPLVASELTEEEAQEETEEISEEAQEETEAPETEGEEEEAEEEPKKSGKKGK